MDNEARLQILEDFMHQLMQSSSIPREVQTAFEERLGGLNGSGTGTPGTQVVFGSTPVTVPANPSKTLIVTYKGVTYELLCK